MKTKIFKGVGIQHTNGIIYSVEEWKTNEFKPEDARGIAVGDGIHSLCLYKEVKSNLAWSSDYKRTISECFTTTDICSAEKDFNGEENTNAILKAVSDRLISDAPAAQWIRETYGSEAYLPAAGELVMIVNNKDEISKCSDLINGNLQELFGSDYWFPWSSTQDPANFVWVWDSYYSSLYHDNKFNNSDTEYTLACVAL